MPVRTPKVSQTVSYRMADGSTTDAVVLARQEAAPAAAGFTVTNSGTGGTLAAGTYSYRVSAVINGLETPASTAKTTTTTGTTSTATVDWTTAAASAPYANATAFKVYGRTSGSELLLATVNMPTTTYVDTGAATPSGALPSNTGAVKIKLIFYKTVLAAVAKATASKQTNRYYAR